MEQVIVALALIFILALLLITPTPAVWLLVGFGVIGWAHGQMSIY
jgi:hypothetical protein